MMSASCRVIVISDTHGRFQPLYRIIEKHRQEAACFLHLGDGWDEVEDIRSVYPQLRLLAVPGNCDFGVRAPLMQSVTVGGKTILFTHGHLHRVKYGTDLLKQTARAQGADIVLYGHTHRSSTEYDQGLYVMNPGSPVLPRDSAAGYGIIDIGSAGIVLNLVKL